MAGIVFYISLFSLLVIDCAVGMEWKQSLNLLVMTHLIDKYDIANVS